jgi:hypothetical protein
MTLTQQICRSGWNPVVRTIISTRVDFGRCLANRLRSDASTAVSCYQMANFAMRSGAMMARSQSRLTAEIDFDRDGKQHGFIRLPYSVHRSA